MFRNRRHLVSRALGIGVLTTICALGIAAEETAAPDPGWPRQIDHEKGTLLIYQPQLESFEGDRLRSRAAFSVALTEKGDAPPVFGVIWTDTRVLTDRDERTMTVVDVTITDVRFPDITDDQKERFSAFVESQVGKWNLVLSLDRVLTSLAALEEESELAEGLGTDPPTILLSTEPAVLILIDGEPRYRSINDDELRRVANTPYTIVMDPKKKKHYLDGGIQWYVSDAVLGPYVPADKVPKKVRKTRSPEADKVAEETKKGTDDYTPPRVIIATEPTELIVTDGKAEYQPIEGTTALYVNNADNDILLDVDTQQHYVVLSGRWYMAKSLEGPWSYVASDALPATFSDIPADSPQAHVLAFIAGTEQAQEALMDNLLPQTAAVRRGEAQLLIDYDGAPQFKPIEGTAMEYAVNTSYSVLKIDGRYWVCHKAVWYEGPGPNGPWQVADFRPDAIDEIPPTNPHYNTKYVYVYDSTPDVVYVGYTPGYVGSYAYGGCVVYGTGWYYPPWYGRVYYPYHATWGFSMRYNPWYGWGVGVSWSNGPFTISVGYSGWGGYGYPYPRGYWGPGGIGYVPVPVYPGRPVYRPPGGWNPGTPISRPGINPPETRPSFGGENLYKLPENRNRVASTVPSRNPAAATDRANNVFAGRDGNVYRRDSGGSWQRRDGGGWKGSQPTGGLERDQRARTRGNTRAGNWSNAQGSRPAPRPAAPRGGGRRR